jgi:glycosyltransferase involved in cell wall biosynthesis
MSRGVVILSIHDWWYHSHGYSDMQLARAFARRMPVLFVNSIGMRFPGKGTVSAPAARILRKVKSTARRFRFPDPALPNLAVATPISFPIYSGSFGRLNLSLVAAQVRRFCSRAHISKAIVLVAIPTYAPVAMRLPSEVLFYKRSDLHSAFEGIDVGLIREREEALLQNADAVLYASDYLFRKEQARVKCAILIGHGVDTALFKPDGLVSRELEGIPHPRVAFFGELRVRSVDFDLIGSVARLCPAIQFVLGGAQLDDLSQVRSLANVHLLPPCPHQEMPQRWRAVDAAILPYKRNPWLQASEPVKLNEILAMGIPAVGTAIPSLGRHSEFVYIADGPEGFASALQRALATLSPGDIEKREARRTAANLQTWDSIVDRIDRASRDITHVQGVLAPS